MGEMILTAVLPSAKTGIACAASLNADMSNAVIGPTNNSVGVYAAPPPITGLANDARYYFAIYADGAVQTQAIATARTPKASGSFAFALAGCTFTTADRAIYDSVRTFVPAVAPALSFMSFRGDLGYPDDASLTVADVHANFATAFAWPKLAALWASMPVPYKPSDHDGDYAAENSSFTGLRTRTAITNLKTGFQQRVPFKAAIPVAGGLANIWRFGRILFVDLCERTERDGYGTTDGPSKTMLGPEQKAFYKACVDLAKANGWAMGYFGDVSWNSTQPIPNPSWSAYTYERTELADYVQSVGMSKRVFHMHSDFHLTGADLGRYGNFVTTGLDPWPTLCGGPLGRTESPGVVTNFTEGQYHETAFQFLTVDVKDEGGATIEMTARGWGSPSASDGTLTPLFLARWLIPIVDGADTSQSLITDTFTAANATTLLTHISDVGGSWGQQAGYANTAAAINDNRLYFPGGGTSGYRHSQIAPRAACKVSAVLDYVGAHASDQIGVYLRGSASADTLYLARYSKSSGNFAITKIANGAASGVGTTYNDAFTSGSRVVDFEIDDSVTPTLNLYVDGVLRCTYTDSSSPILQSRGVGVRSANGQTTTTGRHVSSFLVTA